MSAFEHQDFGVIVVRRCVDLADLLAAASAGTARAVILSADLRRLDRDALARLATAGVAVIGLVAQGGLPGTSDDAERRLRQLGVRHVLAADAGPALISAEVATAIADGVATGGAGSAAPWVRRPARRAARRPGTGPGFRRGRSPSGRRTARCGVGPDRCARPDDDCGRSRDGGGASWLPVIASGRRLLRRGDCASTRAAR